MFGPDIVKVFRVKACSNVTESGLGFGKSLDEKLSSKYIYVYCLELHNGDLERQNTNIALNF